ncbi:hypothetical protein [Bradyrhizobium sp. USDA 4451]
MAIANILGHEQIDARFEISLSNPEVYSHSTATLGQDERDMKSMAPITRVNDPSGQNRPLLLHDRTGRG